MQNINAKKAALSFPEMEEEVLDFWDKAKIFKKSVERKPLKKDYVFYDGPPFATGTPHYGHIAGNLIKDAIPRYWTMRGFRVERKWGWDCHGLPIENIVEKEMGSKSKKDIEKIGVDKFNERCKSKVLKYVDEWKKTIRRLGRWADMENCYKTMDLDFMESVWWVFKQLYDKGLIYEGYRSMHICPRCETTLSQSEVAEGYRDIKDLSATVKFKLEDFSKLQIKYKFTNSDIIVKEAKTDKDKNGCLAVRKEVFVKEQNIPQNLENDKFDNDKNTRHFFAINQKGETIGVCRVRLYEDAIKLERMAVLKSTRGKGVGKILTQYILDNIKEKIFCHAQNYVKNFYTQLGFISEGDTFKEAGIEHIKMVYKKPKIFILAWTTTPWTLIGNVALAVGENIKYTMVKIENDFYILAKDRIEEVLKDKEYEFVADINGEDLIGLKYEPVFDYYSKDANLKNRENGWKIYAGNFVNTDDGTGVVHIAPAFGDDDMKLGKKENLPFIQHIGMDGVIKKEAGEFVGLNVKPLGDHQKTDIEIIKYLARENLLFAKKKYEHSYPHCWRCDSPLLNYATSSWFVNILKIKKRMLELAEDINWSPEHIKKGRWGKWLEGARDWSISRQRFWASVIPIWKCGSDVGNQKSDVGCGNIKVIGSIDELEKLSGQKVNDLHKHTVDKITFKCEKCDGEMRRVPDVLDCWFESGSMPYAQAHYPFENREKFEKNFPAEFIGEGADQTRCWFYYLHAIATGIKDSAAFKNVIVNGIVLAEDGMKMSKKLQNYPKPDFLFEKYSGDALRYYLLSSPVMLADTLCFAEQGVQEAMRKNIMLLWNVVKFYLIYENPKSEIRNPKSDNVLDKWILARLNQLIAEVTENMNKYNLPKATRPIEDFISDLSTWYIRRSRDRFKGEDEQDKKLALQTTRFVLLQLSKIIAPFMPFIAEQVWQKITGNDFQDENRSVHLESWVKAEKIDDEVLENMDAVRRIVELGLAARDEAEIKVRQPLASLEVKSKNEKLKISDDYLKLIKDEVNVKKIEFKKEDVDLSVKLCTKLTPELKQEGIKREIVRLINAMRKNAGMTIHDRAVVYWECKNKEIKQAIKKLKKDILKDTLADEIIEKLTNDIDIKKEVEINTEKIFLGIKKI